MGIDCQITWDTQTEKDRDYIKSLYLRHFESKGIFHAPILGYLRERYGIVYHFTPFLFREAWSHESERVCRITSEEFGRRYKEVVSDMREGNKHVLRDKYTYMNDPVKNGGMHSTIQKLRLSGHMVGPSGEEEDKEESYHRSSVIDLHERDYEYFTKFLEVLEKDKLDPYVVVSY